MVTVTNFPPVAIQIAEQERRTAIALLDGAEIGDTLGGAQLAMRLGYRVGRRHRQGEAVRRRQELLSPRDRQHDDVPRRGGVLDVDREAPAAGDLQAEDVAVERRARLLVVALERAVGERLRHVAASRKLLLR